VSCRSVLKKRLTRPIVREAKLRELFGVSPKREHGPALRLTRRADQRRLLRLCQAEVR
jgi:hypothetical protein